MARFFLAFGLLAFLVACTPHPNLPNPTGDRVEDSIISAHQLRQDGKAAAAASLLEQALANHPDNPDLLAQLGYAQIAAGQPRDAVATFDRLIAINPQSAGAYDGKAMAFDHAGNHLAAQDLYQQALQLAPGSLRIRNNLAVSLILNGQASQAISLLEKLDTTDGGNHTVRQNLALAYGLSGQTDKAMALNMEDLPADQAKENMRFYTAYRQRLAVGDVAIPKQIGFAEAPAAAAISPPQKPVEPVPAEASPAESAMPNPPQNPPAVALPGLTDIPPPVAGVTHQ